jgi:glutathione S-transferase
VATDDPTLARAKVPVLEHLDDGSPPLVESLVIAEYLEDRFPVMATRSAEQRAAVRLFVEKFNGAMSYMALLRAEPGSEAETEAKAALAAGMQAMDSFLRAYADSEGPFFFGSTFSLAEEACAPFALRFWHVLPAMRPEHAPRAMLEEGKLERLRAWLEAVVERPSVKATAMAPDEMVQSYANMLERMKAMAAK